MPSRALFVKPTTSLVTLATNMATRLLTQVDTLGSSLRTQSSGELPTEVEQDPLPTPLQVLRTTTTNLAVQ